MNRSNCLSCNAPLIWLKGEPSKRNPNPKPNPIDAQSSITGNIEINTDAGTYKILKPLEQIVAALTGTVLHASHFATCPDAKKFRR